MFVLILLGVFCFKKKILTDSASKHMTDLLLYVVNPLVVINAYNMPFNPELATNLGMAFLLGIISHLIAMAVAYITVRSKGNNENAAIERFSIIYTNCGFMALPLINAMFGSEGVFYASAYMTVFNLLSWTHGYITISKKADKAAIIKAFTSPVVISVAVGLILFFCQIRLPLVIADSVAHMASLNTPIAMLITGVSLAQTNIIKAFKTPRLYYIVFVANLLVPLIASCVYLFLPINQSIILINLVAVACPCAVTTLLFSTRLGKNVTHATNLLTVSNVSCVITIPLVIFIYQLVSGLL